MAITNGYATLAELKAVMRIPSVDTLDDSLLETSIEAASRQLDGFCERVFYSTSATRVFVPNDSYVCETDDIVSITTLKTTSDGEGFDTTWAVTDYQKEPLNGTAGGIVTPTTQLRAIDDFLFPVFGGEATVQVVGTFGWSAVPIAIKQATLMLAQRQFKRYDSPLGVAGVGDLGVMRISRIDPDVQALVSPFRRVRFA
jgi:hypothetical protein